MITSTTLCTDAGEFHIRLPLLVGQLIKRLREEKQWSQEQLGELCGLNLRTIQRLEKSENP